MRLSVAAFLVTGMLSHSLALSDSIRLHDQAGSTDSVVRLSSVAQLEGPAAQACADLVVATFQTGQRQLRVGIDVLRQQLSSRGVNWGQLTLRGFSVCTVQLLPATKPVRLAKSDMPAPAVANPAHPVELSTPLTLLDHTLAFLTEFVGAPRHDLRVKFSDHDRRALGRSVERDRLEFEPLVKVGLGRVPLVIRRYRGGHVVGSQRVTADIARRAQVVVATQGIRRHQLIDANDIAVREVFLNKARSEPHTQVQDVVGRIAVSVLRPGAILYPQHVRAQRLVRRNETVRVRCVVGGLLIKTVARAMADGSQGEWIPVRNEHRDSRQTYMARVTRLREVTLDMNDLSLAGPVPWEQGAPARTRRRM